MGVKKKVRSTSPEKGSSRKGKKELTEEEQEQAEKDKANADAERVRESIIRDEKAAAKAKRIALAAEEESSKRFTGFKGLYGIGTHDIFFIGLFISVGFVCCNTAAIVHIVYVDIDLMVFGQQRKDV